MLCTRVAAPIHGPAIEKTRVEVDLRFVRQVTSKRPRCGPRPRRSTRGLCGMLFLGPGVSVLQGKAQRRLTRLAVPAMAAMPSPLTW
jgi:hypothetical protein